MAEIKKLLDDAIETEINNLNSASDKDEKSEVIKNLAALHKLRIEEIKTETEIEEKSERRAMDKAAHDEDATLKAFQLDENTLDRYAKIGIAAAELVLPLMFYGVWMRRGLRFEETGTFTSQTFKNLFNRFKPMIKRRNNYEEDHAFPALLYPGDYVRPLPGGRSSSPQLQGVTNMEGIANFISMLDYVLDTKRKRHITGGLLLSGALLFGGLAMTVMSIRDDEEDEDE